MENIKDYFLPSWNHLAKVGNNRIVRSSYYWIIFVPIVAKFIEKFPDELAFELNKTPLDLTLSLPFSWKIFYFSSLCFGIATLIFSWKCPDLIKKYANYSDFKASGLNKNQLNIFLANWLRNGGVIRDAGNNVVSHKEAVNAIYDKYSKQNQPNLLTIKESWYAAKHIEFDSSKESDAFWYIQSIMYNDKIKSRSIVTTVYILGFLSILFLIGSNIYYVVKVSF